MKNIIRIDSRIRVFDPSKFMDEPVIIRVTNFDNDSAAEFSDDMSKAHNTGQPIIPVIIDSPGGQVYSLFSMISDIQNAELPVATIAVGKAMSAGAILLSCGTEGYRYIDPNAHVMIHDVSLSHFSGKNEEMKAESAHTDKLQKQVFRLMAKNCGYADADYFLKHIHDKGHAEWYLSAKDVKRHRLANHIKIPGFITTVKVETTFS